MKKIWIVLGLVLLTATVLCGVYAYRNPFILTALKLYSEALVTSTTPEWKTFRSSEAGLELESPFSVSWKTEKKPSRSGGFTTIVMGRSTTNRSRFLILSSTMIFTESGSSKKPADILAFVLDPKRNNILEGQTYDMEAVTCSGWPATLVTNNIKSPQYTCYMFEMHVSHGDRNWNIRIGHDNSDAQKEWVKRVLGSIKITAPEAKQ